MVRNIVIVTFSLILLSSCSPNSNDCSAIDPVPPEVKISIVDSEGNSLIGENNIYKPSEITLTRGDQTIFLMFSEYNEKTYINLYYPEMESGKDYKLKLNDQETDILNLQLKLIPGACFDFLSVEAFFLNGEEIQFDNDSYSYIIRK